MYLYRNSLGKNPENMIYLVDGLKKLPNLKHLLLYLQDNDLGKYK